MYETNINRMEVCTCTKIYEGLHLLPLGEHHREMTILVFGAYISSQANSSPTKVEL